MIGILLINLGTPDNPDRTSVKRYLGEFLNDPYVIDLATPLRWLLVNLLIAPFRSKRSARAYEKIWTKAGSPLLVNSQALLKQLQQQLGGSCLVELGMRYGNPSISSALKRLKANGATQIYALPLYPQFADSSTQTAIDEVVRCAQALALPVTFKPEFYADDDFINAELALIKPYYTKGPVDHLLLSFHGLPESHILKRSPNCTNCLSTSSCQMTQLADCYRAQCYKTAALIAQQLNLTEQDYTVCFQSRLGRVKWIEPYTEVLLESLPKQGIKHLLVACPAFTADCLETIEEIGMNGAETFKAAGGDTLTLVPSLNASPAWVDTLVAWCQAYIQEQGVELDAVSNG